LTETQAQLIDSLMVTDAMSLRHVAKQEGREPRRGDTFVRAYVPGEFGSVVQNIPASALVEVVYLDNGLRGRKLLP
jgi:hypothetical protein